MCVLAGGRYRDLCEAIRDTKHQAVPELDTIQLESTADRCTGILPGLKQSAPVTRRDRPFSNATYLRTPGHVARHLAVRIADSVTDMPADRWQSTDSLSKKINDGNDNNRGDTSVAADGASAGSKPHPSPRRRADSGDGGGGVLGFAYGRSLMSAGWQATTKRAPGRVMTPGSWTPSGWEGSGDGSVSGDACEKRVVKGRRGGSSGQGTGRTSRGSSRGTTRKGRAGPAADGKGYSGLFQIRPFETPE